MKAIIVALLVVNSTAAGLKPPGKKGKEAEPSLLEQYIKSASEHQESEGEASPGALWSPSARLTDLGRDLRASQVNDVVTVVVSEVVNAVASGASSSARTSSAKASITSLAGKKS